MSTVVAAVDLDDRGVPLRHYWSHCVGAGRATDRRAVTADAGGVLDLRLELEPWAVAALRGPAAPTPR